MLNTHYLARGGPSTPGGSPAHGGQSTGPEVRSHAQGKLDPLIQEGLAIWGSAPQLQQVPADTRLYQQDARAEEAFLVLEGRFELVRHNAVRSVPLDLVERGYWLGVPEMLQRRPYASTAHAKEAALVLPVSRLSFELLLKECPALTRRALVGCTRQALGLLESLEAQVLDQTFIGLCRGLELIMAGTSVMPESQLIARLRELFALPTPSLREALKLLSSLNLLSRQQEIGKEAMVGIPEGRTFAEKVKSFADQWRGKLPSLVGEAPPREAYGLEEISGLLGVKPEQLLRRMTMKDFPTGVVRFDPEGVELVRNAYGDQFFKKKLSGKEMLAQLEMMEDLLEVEPELLRDILPRMPIPRLIRLLSCHDDALRTHLIQALSSRMKRTVCEELEHQGVVPSLEQADLELELLSLCKSA